MKKKLLVHVAVALCLAGVANAQETTLGVYFDDMGTTCSGTMSGGVVQGTVWANLAGAGAAGITGTEFRIDWDTPNFTDLTATFVPDNGINIAIGDPFDRDGVNLAFSSCNQGTNSRIRLGGFVIIDNTPGVGETWLTVRKKYWPTNHIMDCPVVTLCDAPVYTAVCVSPADSDHWRAVVNPDVGTTADCSPVAVTESTWSQVKGIFAN